MLPELRLETSGKMTCGLSNYLGTSLYGSSVNVVKECLYYIQLTPTATKCHPILTESSLWLSRFDTLDLNMCAIDFTQMTCTDT